MSLLKSKLMILSPLPTVPPLPLCCTAHHLSKRTKMFLRGMENSSDVDSLRWSWQIWFFAHENVNDFVFKFCFDFVLVFSESSQGSGDYRSIMTDIITLIILSLSVLVKFGSALATCSNLAIDSNDIYEVWMQNVKCENIEKGLLHSGQKCQ